MKKLSAIVLVLVFAASVFAHPPSEIKFTVSGGNMLTLNIAHNSKDTTKHFVDDIKLMVNGKQAIIQNATTQTSSDGQVVMYTIPGLKAGDKLTATGDCSIFGELTVDHTVPAEEPAKAKAPKAMKMK